MKRLKFRRSSATPGLPDAPVPVQGLSGPLTVMVLEAEDLPFQSAAHNLHCDPYCCVKLGKKHSYKTSIRKRTVSPTWNELVVDEDVQGIDHVSISVKDWKRIGQHRTLGTTTIDLHRFMDGTEKDEWVNLSPQGRVRIRILFEDVSCLFGLPLSDVCARETSKVPVILRRCIEEIETRGINDRGLYRVSGKLSTINELRQEFILSSYTAVIDKTAAPNISSVAAVVKLYLRELPEPLFTSALYPSFMEAATRRVTDETRMRFFHACLLQLPSPNYDTVVYLLDHLTRVIANSGNNMMTAGAVATCFGPTVFTPAESDTNAMKAYNVLGQNAVVQFLLERWPKLREMLQRERPSDLEGPPAPSPSPSPQPASPTEEADPGAGGPLPSIVVSPGEIDTLHKLLEAPDAEQDDAAVASPLPSPTRESLSSLSSDLFQQFDKEKTGRLTPSQFQNLCEHVGLEVPTTPANGKKDVFSSEELSTVLEADQELEARSTARARAQSVASLMKRFEKRGRKGKDQARSLVAIQFRKHATQSRLSADEFRLLTYDLGYFVADTKAAFGSFCRGQERVPFEEFYAWWEANGAPLVATAYTMAKHLVFRQAITNFQYHDKDGTGHIDMSVFAQLHADILEQGYTKVPKLPVDCLKQMDRRVSDRLEFNTYIAWIISTGLEIESREEG